MRSQRIVARLALTACLLLGAAGCNDPDERKTHYVTIVRSQDVEVREEYVDTGLKKPTVVVHHPEGVEVRHLPTRPRKTVSFDRLPPAGLALAFLALVMAARPAPARLVRLAAAAG